MGHPFVQLGRLLPEALLWSALWLKGYTQTVNTFRGWGTVMCQCGKRKGVVIWMA